MLQIAEKDRDVIGLIIASGIYPNCSYSQVNQAIKVLEQLKPIEDKKKKE